MYARSIKAAKLFHSSEVNVVPLSEVMSSGTPNRATQLFRKACAHELDVASERGIASGHLVARSIAVNIYRQPLLIGKGPTTSTWTCPNRRLGSANVLIPDSVCLVTLQRWQRLHARAQALTSRAIPRQTYLEVISRTVVRIDG